MVEYQKLVRERCGPGAVAALADAVEKREPWAIKIAIEYAAGKPMQAVEMSGKGGGPIQTQAVQDAVGKLTQEERLTLLALYRKAGLKLPGEV